MQKAVRRVSATWSLMLVVCRGGNVTHNGEEYSIDTVRCIAEAA